MSEDTQEKLCAGYLITGEQITVEGGFTVDFQKRNKYYFVLWKTGEHIYHLEGFADEKAFKGKRNSSFSMFGTLRKKSTGSNNIPSYMLTSTVKIHCMDMTIGRKKNHVIILVHAKIPYYFKTMKEQEIKPWYKALKIVANDMESRNIEGNGSDEVVLRNSPVLKHMHHASADSGRGSNCSSLRSSQGSCGSRLSDMDNSCPPSPSYIPTNIMIDIDQADGLDDGNDLDTPTSSGQKARRQLTGSVIYRRRNRTDSSDEQSGMINFTEAPPQTYELVIRKSLVVDDADDIDYDYLPPELPEKTRIRRGSEPNLLMPAPHHHHHHHHHPGNEVQRRSPKTQRTSTQEAGNSPPPIPVRPQTHIMTQGPYYVNVVRKQSSPASLNLMSRLCPPSLEQTYEQPERVQENIGRLEWEQSKVMDGVLIEFSKAELLDSLVLTTINKGVWVAGWKKDLESQLYGKLHVGDKLIQINNQVVSSADLAMEFIRSTAQDKTTVTLSRLPHAKLLNLSRSDQSIYWGIHLKSNIEIKSLTDGPAMTEGLTPKAKCVYSAKPCDWVITEINHRRVPLVKSGKNQDLVKTELEEDHYELPLIVQPHDFIKKLSEAVQKRPNSQFC